MVLDAIVSRVGGMLGNMLKEEVVMLWGVTQEIPDLEMKMRMIQDVLEDNESRRIQDKSIHRWLMELKDILYDIDDIIDRCRIEGERRDRLLANRTPAATTTKAWVRCLLPVYSCYIEVAFRHEIGSRIKTIHVRLDKIAKLRSDLIQLTPTARDDIIRVEVSEVSRQTSPLEEPDVVGIKIEQDTSSLVELMTREEKKGNRVLLFAIVGMGGVGKTTLARRIFNHTTITTVFQINLWICVSKDFDELKLLSEIISSAGGSHGEAQTRSQLELVLNLTVNQKKIFLVLDDVWKEEIWEDLLRVPLQSCASGSRILITTRHDSVAQLMGAIHRHQVDLLSPEDGWSLLCKKAFSTRVKEEEEEDIQELKEIGMKIVGKCGHLPLAIKAIGGVLKTKKNKKVEWEKLLSSSAWSITGLPEGINKALYLSYQDLPYHLKQCFLYCSLFPEDYTFQKYFIIEYWIAEGLVCDREGLTMDEKAECYNHDLISRSLLQASPNYVDQSQCTMHDLLRSLAQFLSQDENVFGNSQGLNMMTFPKPRRLSLANAEATSLPILYESLRTLLAHNRSIRDIPIGLPNKVMHLRVLNLAFTAVECLPNSVGNLVHLRYLDLSYTRIREIPETIGDLSSLQFLMLQRCEHLNNLPLGITHLYNLRMLDLFQTPVRRIPTGIGRLENLRVLHGFVASGVDSGDGQLAAGGCSLGELNSLSNIKRLRIDKLEMEMERERILSAGIETKRAPPLIDMLLLKYLMLCCTSRAVDEDPYTEDEQVRIKEVFEELCPPPNLETLYVENFFGKEYPSWMMKPSECLPNLESLYLINCCRCQQLPLLGPLRQLEYIKIEGANTVVTIGPEFFGRGIHSFSKLKYLDIRRMPAWEDWCGVEDGALPHLHHLCLLECPKLRSLPDGLRHLTALTILTIFHAESLRAIENLMSVKDLRVWDCPNLKRVSNLLALETLMVDNCPSLMDVENSLGVVRHLKLYDYSMESLPKWLGQLQQQQHSSTGTPLQVLEIHCSSKLLRKLSHGEYGPYWPMIHYIPHVRAFTGDKSKYFSYSKSPLSISTNISTDEEEEDVVVAATANDSVDVEEDNNDVDDDATTS